MLRRLSSLRKPQLFVPVLVVIGLLAQGARRAYCHFSHSMAASVTQAAHAGEEHLPVVTVVEPIRKPAVQTVTLSASVEAFEKATLYAKAAGYLKWIKVDKGDAVRRDEILALLEIPETERDYQSAQAAVQEGQAALERAQADAALKELTFKRLASVRQSQPDVIPQHEVDVARAAYEVARGEVKLATARLEVARSGVAKLEALMEYARIKAPYDGVVTERFVDPGALIQAGTSSKGNPIVTVASVDKVRIYVAVPEREVPYLKRGDSAEVLLDAFPGKSFAGRITRFATALDPETRTMKTEIDLPNATHVIRPGMYGTASLRLAAEANGLFLPAPSVHQDAAGAPFVFTVAEGRVRKVAVGTGLDDGKLIQVTGLRGDEVVVLTSTANLQEGLSVRAVKSGF